MAARSRQLWVSKASGILLPGVEEAVRKMHADGMRDQAIAEALGVSSSAIRQVRHQLGIEGHGARVLDGESRPINVRFSTRQIAEMRTAAAIAGLTLRAWIRKRCETT